MKTSRSLNVGLFLGFSTLLAWPASYTDTLVPGWNMIANHLDLPNNGINNVLNNPTPPDGAVVVFWNPAIQAFNDSWQYDSFAGGWISPSDPNPDGAPLNTGGGAFFFNPTAANITQVYSGTAPTPWPSRCR